MVRLWLLTSVLSLPAWAEEYLVAAQELPAGSTVTMEVLSQKSAKVKVRGALTVDDAPRVLHQRLMVPLRKGDLVMWFAFSVDTRANERCNAAAPR
jgi:hypothetical protein